MTQVCDNTTKPTWEFAANWSDDDGKQHIRFGFVKASNRKEASQSAKEQTHPSATIAIVFSGWNR